jgi:hypothetical protein
MNGGATKSSGRTPALNIRTGLPNERKLKLAKLTSRGRAVESARTPIPSYMLDRSAFHRIAGFAVWEESGTGHGGLAPSISLQYVYA